jgi:hypothetical protein
VRHALVLLLLLAGCSAREPVTDSTAMEPELVKALEDEVAAIRADPGESVGFGEKSYIPYEPNVAHGLISVDDVGVTEMLREEIEFAGDRVYKLALLHVVGKRSDAHVDDVLIDALEDPELRATSAYLLGRPGFKGYPERPRNLRAVKVALRRHVADESTFEDPFYRETFRTQDFVIAALVRLIGPEKFEFEDPQLGDNIGYELPRIGEKDRAGLLEQLERLR